jgi:hypothetical protein
VVREELAVVAGEDRRLDLTLGTGGSIVGRVVLDDGSPAAGASVAFTGQGRGTVYTSVSTADDGTFAARGLLPGTYTVKARRKAPPWNQSTSLETPDLRIVTVADAEVVQGIALTVVRGGHVIGGRVSLPDGQPAAGTPIVVNLEQGGRSWKPHKSERDDGTIAREDGTFLLEDLEAGTFTLWATRPGFPEVELGGITAGRRDVEVALRAPGSVAGLVVDGSGRPVPAFAINVVPAGGNRAERDQAHRFERLVRDSSGAFAWGGLGAGDYELRVVPPQGGGVTRTITLAEGERRPDLRLVVQAGVRVSGRAVELESGAPLGGLNVGARLGSRVASTSTDATGAFSLELLPGETGSIDLRALGDGLLVPEMADIEVPRTGVTAMDLGVFRLMKGPWNQRLVERGFGGTYVRGRPGATVIGEVRPDSPAHAAGVVKGDAVLAVGGRDVTGLGPGAVNHLMIRKPGETVSVTIQTAGGAPRTVSWTLTKRPGGRPAP